jgi:hypothetical protein
VDNFDALDSDPAKEERRSDRLTLAYVDDVALFLENSELRLPRTECAEESIVE